MLLNFNSKYLVFFCSLSYCFYFISNNFVFSLIPIILCIAEIRNCLHILIIFIAISLFFLSVDYYNSKDILLLGISTTLYMYRFKSLNPLDILKYNAYPILIMLSYFLFLEPKNSSWLDSVLFQSRLSFDLFTGKFINPNPLGLVSAICAVGLILNKKYLFSVIPLITMMATQSRAAILFLILIFAIYYTQSLKKMIIYVVISLLSIFMLKDTLLFSRFSESGDSGRSEHIGYYLSIFKENYLTGYSIRQLDELYFNTGLAIDNMYYSLFIRYGIIMGGGILFIYFYLFLKNFLIKDEYFRLRLSIFFSMLVYGFFEKGFLFTYMLWIPLSICFSNLKRVKV